MSLSQYQVDVFTRQVFTGNPAAVLILDQFLPADMMQSIAAENNLSETVFAVPRPQVGHYDLRWFTPTTEIEFCGHATIATAHVLWSELGVNRALTGALEFHGQIGALSVNREDNGLYCLSAPIARPAIIPVSKALQAAFVEIPLVEAFTAGPNLYAVCESAHVVENHAPDLDAIIPLSQHGVGLTARGDDFRESGYDFISRFFVPAGGIDEDPVTGSAHAALGPYWSERLGKRKLKAYQASKRGGEVSVEVGSDRVLIRGHAVTFMRGEIYLP